MFDDKVHKTIPAPGHYPLSNGAFSKRGVLMGKKLKSMSNLIVPGAGTYQPDYSPSKTQNPRFSMGIKLKPELNKLKVPGPGQYTNRAETLKTAAPSYGFGSS